MLSLVRLEDDGVRCFGMIAELGLHVLEPPWKDNEIKKSCIPVGDHYMLFPHVSPSRGKCLIVRDTSPRTFILWHSGNVVKHTLGCQLIGRRRGWLGEEPAVLASRSAMTQVLRMIQQPTPLRIVNAW